MGGRTQAPGGELGFRPRASRAAPGARPRSPLGVVLVCGLAGFLLGAGFWAYIGLRELGLDARAGQAPAPGCTAFALDRPSGRITAAPCLPADLARSLTALADPLPRP